MANPKEEFVFAPLGGAGEIGMNLALYGYGSERLKKWLVVDFGVSFGSAEEQPGVDLVMPDISFAEEQKKNIVGIVLTHAHEDHFGALFDLWPRLPVPVYATPFTAALIEAKRASEAMAPEIKVVTVPLKGKVQLGPFEVEFVNVAHSIPESNSLIIGTPLGKALHTGDWKLDPTPLIGTPTDEARLRALGDEGCIAMIGDSTNAVREGRSPSEADVAKTLTELVRNAPARVAVTTFASNIARIKAVALAAKACEREVVVVGRAMERFARFLGFTGRADFAKQLLGHLNRVQGHYAALFEAMPAMPGQAPIDVSKEATRPDYFAERGFAKPLEAAATVERWFSGRYRSLKSELARSELADLVPQFVSHAVRSENPDAALAALDRFLEALHGGAQLYSLLKQNPDLVSLLVTILATAPRLADILAQQPEVMDGVMEPAFFGALPGEAQLEKALRATFGQSDTFEDFLDRARVFGREHMFLIGVRVISGTVSAAQAGEAFAQLAGVLIRAMLDAAMGKFVAEHGKLKRQEIALLALGKLGGYEMTAGSDLDLIVIYDFDERAPESDGERSLHGGQYFARLTQRVVNSLTVPTNYGKLYDVDMRLRPSGRSGPLATSLSAFGDYQQSEAWTWEHMALTRARVLSAPPTFAGKIEKIIRGVLCRSRSAPEIAGDVLEMREAVANERGEDERWNIKDAAGGLLDIEFIAQYLQLVHAADHPEILDTNTARVLEKATRLGLLSAEDSDVLRPAVRLYHDLTQILRLCLSGPFEPKKAGAGLAALLTRAGDVPDLAALEAHLADTQQRVRETFKRILGSGSES